MQVILAKPRGFCAGVERAIRVVEVALEEYSAPVYVRKEIVHNAHVVQRLRERGAVFVEEFDEVPFGAILILPAHGSPPQVVEQARARRLRLLDATCPLVTKVHNEIRAHVQRGYRIILIGHAGHDEVVGTLAQAPEQTTLVETVGDVARLDLPLDQKGVILTQTTLSQDDAREVVDALRTRFPQLELPCKEDICYATQNRQNAVKAMVARIDVLLVVGSQSSSNSIRLTEVAKRRGVPAYLVDDCEGIDPDWLADVSSVGVTSGASTPKAPVAGVLARLRELGVTKIEELDAPDEDIEFRLPPFIELSQRARPAD